MISFVTSPNDTPSPINPFSWARRYARDDLRSLVLLRLLPWAGGNLANLIAGARGVPLRTHLLAAALGSLPGSVIYALLGAGVVSL